MAKILTRYLGVRHYFYKALGVRRLSSTNYDASSNDTGGNHNEETFHEMFRRSQFAKLVRPANKVVLGKIVHVINDELYIDMGWKFHAVVKIASSKINR